MTTTPSPSFIRAMRHIDWQDPEFHTTNRGKRKLIRKGIPAQAFWRNFRNCKQEFAAMRVSLNVTDTIQEYSRKTGKTKARKLWEVIAWDASIIN